MTKLNSTELKTLNVIFKTGFTFCGDSHFRTYRQARVVLNRLERLGLVRRREGDTNAFVLTRLGEDTQAFPMCGVAEIAAWLGDEALAA